MTGRWQVSAGLLDMDGTLIDSERVYMASLTSALALFACADGPALGHAMIGLPGPECQVMLRNRLGPVFRMPRSRAPTSNIATR